MPADSLLNWPPLILFFPICSIFPDLISGTGELLIVGIVMNHKLFTFYFILYTISFLIGVSRPALHKWSKAGIVRSHKLGGKLFYFENEVIEDLKKC